MISARPAEAADRAVPGHWEGDLILGLRRSAIGTLVERTTRFTMLLHLPPDEDEMAERARTATGVRGAVMGHGAEAVRDAITAAIATLPVQLRRSLTWDQGAEMARHDDLRIKHDLPVYFCDPNSPWQRGTNENDPRAAPAVLPQGHRPHAPRPRRARSRRRCAQRATPQDPWMEDTRGGAGRAADDRPRCRRCNDRLRPPTSLRLLCMSFPRLSSGRRRSHGHGRRHERPHHLPDRRRRP